METEKKALEEISGEGGSKELPCLLASLCRGLLLLALTALAALIMTMSVALVRSGGAWGAINGAFMALFALVTILALAPRKQKGGPE